MHDITPISFKYRNRASAQQEQAEEYGHSFERELSYMVVHGFYHLMGYDHIELGDRVVMREKEEKVLESLNITFHHCRFHNRNFSL